jgi:hypothetical protein
MLIISILFCLAFASLKQASSVDPDANFSSIRPQDRPISTQPNHSTSSTSGAALRMFRDDDVVRKAEGKFRDRLQSIKHFYERADEQLSWRKKVQFSH